jgi:hypothetical protein
MLVLWWRSYHFYDAFRYNFSEMAPQTCWCNGLLDVGWMREIVEDEPGPLTIKTYPIAKMEQWEKDIHQKHTNVLGFGSINNTVEYVIITPFWFPWIASGVCSAILWPAKTWRYELRTLFVAITVVAVVLGLAAYAANP